MKENWYALLIAIVKGCSVEKALGYMQPNSKRNSNGKSSRKKHVEYSIDAVKIMVEMKKTMSYKNVAVYFGTEDWNVYKHIKKYFPELIKSGELGYQKKHNQKFIS